jgi:D-sedoheptulose 7-phosphate isomerase
MISRMLEQRVQQHFFESADLLYQVAEQLGRPLAFAAQMITDALTGGHRVLTAGQGHAALEADYLAARLAGRFEQDRPGLAAWSLPAQTRAGLDLSRLVQAQGHPGDVLVVIEPETGRDHAWADVLATAHGQEMFVVALTADDWRTQLQDTDLQLRVSAPRAARVVETQRVLVHALCDAIDQLLLGSEE